MAENRVNITVSATDRGAKATLEATAKAAGASGAAWSKLSTGINTAGRAFLGLSAAAAAGIGFAAKSAIAWESSWAGVNKTVSGTSEQLAKLQSDLRGLALELPKSQTEIAAVAATAGQLGVATDDVAHFTKIMIELGSVTSMSADEAATSIAQFMNIMQTAPANVDRLGAALVGLGNNGASTEGDIINMSQRIAGAGKVVGLSEAQVMGLANALASVGVNAEAGGSAVSRTLVDMAKAVSTGNDKLQAFADIAGMSAADFQKAFKEDAAGAIVAFVQGLGNMQRSGQDVFTALDKAGQSNVRVRQALLSLAGAGDLLNASMEQGTKDWADNTALVEAAGKRFDTTAAKVAIARNKINDAAITLGNELLPAISDVATKVGDLAQQFAGLPEPVQAGAVALGVIVTVAAGAAGAFLMLFPRVMETVKAFKALRETNPGVVSSLKGMGAAAGIAAAAYVLLSAAAAGMNSLLSNDDSVEQTTKALLDMKDAATLNINFPGIDNMKTSFERLRDSTMWMGGAVGTVTNWMTFGKSSEFSGITAARKEWEKMGEALASIFQSDPALAADKFNMILKETGGTTEELLKAMPAYADALSGASNQAQIAADGQDGLNQSTRSGTQSIQEYTDALEKQIKMERDDAKTVLDERQAMSDYQQALDDATKALADNGATLDLNTQQGRDNQKALDDIAKSAMDLLGAQQGVGESADTMKASMQDARDKFVELAGPNGMGMAQTAAEELANELHLIPSEIPVRVVMTTTSSTAGVYGRKVRAAGGVTGAASGGPRSGLTLVGEQGPELVDMAPGSKVTPAGQTAQILAGGGGQAITLFVKSSGSAVDNFIAELIRKYVDVVGGGNVQKALGR